MRSMMPVNAKVEMVSMSQGEDEGKQSSIVGPNGH